MKLRIHLSEQSMIDAHAEASKRHQVSRLAGVTNQAESDGHPISVDFIGLLGEIGFAAILMTAKETQKYTREADL